MKKIYFLYVFLLFGVASLRAKSAVTYTFSGGRFGDNLLSYCHAKWVSFKYQITLLYKPFAYSDQLMMHQLEQHLDATDMRQFKAIVNIAQLKSYTIEPDANVLYVVPYFPESAIEDYDRFQFRFMLDWKDPLFKMELKKMIRPCKQLVMPEISKEGMCVGLHVRIGTGFDIPHINAHLNQAQDGTNLKFPPLVYYTEQLKKIIDLFPEKMIIVYLFTDHTDPEELGYMFESMLDCPRIEFKYRTQENRHDLNVLEDFFALTQFDYLIRPDANFALVASKLGDYKILIYPRKYEKTMGNKNIFGQAYIECDPLFKKHFESGE